MQKERTSRKRSKLLSVSNDDNYKYNDNDKLVIILICTLYYRSTSYYRSIILLFIML